MHTTAVKWCSSPNFSDWNEVLMPVVSKFLAFLSTFFLGMEMVPLLAI